MLKGFKDFLESQNLSDSSINNYSTKLEILKVKQINLDGDENKIIEAVSTAYPKILSRKGMLYPVIRYRAYLSLPVDILQEEYKRLQNNYNETQKEQIASKELPSLKDLLKIRFPKNTDPQDKLIYKLYTKHPAIRNDLIDVKKGVDTGNRYDKKSKTIIIEKHKTSKTHGPLKLQLASPEVSLMNALLKKEGEFIFLTSQGKPFSTSGFTAYLKKIFKRLSGYPLSSSDLRKIHVKDSKGKSLKEREELASKMGHSQITAEIHYMKLD